MRLKKFSEKYLWLKQPLIFIGIYAVWIVGFRLLTLTFITYFTISSSAHFQDISDAFSSNEVILMGLSSFLFVGLLYWLNPITAIPLDEIINRQKIEKKFLPGFIQGAFFSGGLVAIFVLFGVYKYLGYLIPYDEIPLELLNVILRMAALASLAYCEEYLFRHRIQKSFQGNIPPLLAANLIAMFYCGIKILQFDLGISQFITLYLVSMALFYRTQRENDFTQGAGIWAALLIVFHPLLSLPIFGNNFTGILLVKYFFSSVSNSILDNSNSVIRFLTGGAGGPISSFIFQGLLILDIGQSILRQKKPSPL